MPDAFAVTATDGSRLEFTHGRKGYWFVVLRSITLDAQTEVSAEPHQVTLDGLFGSMARHSGGWSDAMEYQSAKGELRLRCVSSEGKEIVMMQVRLETDERGWIANGNLMIDAAQLDALSAAATAFVTNTP